jgi:hypothetical protein
VVATQSHSVSRGGAPGICAALVVYRPWRDERPRQPLPVVVRCGAAAPLVVVGGGPVVEGRSLGSRSAVARPWSGLPVGVVLAEVRWPRRSGLHVPGLLGWRWQGDHLGTDDREQARAVGWARWWCRAG